MCGIAGILNKESNSQISMVSDMVRKLDHRGPDNFDVLNHGNSILGFTRLSILDLSSNGSQPMKAQNGRYAIVFNGEIYNFVELKEELSEFYSFKSKTDTEVLLQGFIHWGKDVLSKLNGMFAFCVVDNLTNSAFLARDRFGQKPLFYYRQNNSIVFSSEIKSFSSFKKFKPNKQTWAKYLQHGIYEDDDNTFFDGIMQLNPGHYATFDGLNFKATEYYDIRSKIKKQKINVDDAVEGLREIVKSSIDIHTRADVPYTIGLSGGVDSSAILSALMMNESLNFDVNCFTVDFEDDLNESVWADRAANYFNLNTNIVEMSLDRMFLDLSDNIYSQESPIGGLMNMAQSLNFQKIHKSGYKLVLDGAGVDEVFCGYKSFHDKYLRDLYFSGSSDFEKCLSEYSNFWGIDKIHVKKNILQTSEKIRTEIDGSFSSNSDIIKKEYRYYYDHESSTLQDMQIDYIKRFKLRRGLRMKDRASMQNSVELRVPFIDHNLVEYGLQLDESYYFLHGRTKSIFREIFKGNMDEDVRTSSKRSINAPQTKWLKKKSSLDFISKIINSQSFKDRNFFDIDSVDIAFDRFKRFDVDNSFFVWQWLNFEMWNRIFVD